MYSCKGIYPHEYLCPLLEVYIHLNIYVSCTVIYPPEYL